MKHETFLTINKRLLIGTVTAMLILATGNLSGVQEMVWAGSALNMILLPIWCITMINRPLW